MGARGQEEEMREMLKRRPSPSMIVAIVALVVALTGTAVAGVATISKLSKSEKRKVRGLADQEIAAKAPELSVKSAATAGDVSNQMWAVVNSDATLARSTAGIIGVRRDETSSGKYLVTVNRNISNCYYLGSLGGSEPGVGVRGDISVNAASQTELYVLTSSEFSANADRAFTLLIRC
jgi:hypothetical protein